MEKPHDVSATIDKLAQMEQAVKDPLFMADLRDTMVLFAEVDAEWWEPAAMLEAV